ncbi:MAG: YbaN family protein [Bacteroidetes bacterium]|nr:YbaN family protein [Bacteroidota bacterium]
MSIIKEAVQKEKTISVFHKPIIKWSLIFAGTVFVVIGILGIFLPLLPTTIFFLLAAWCYARSSKTFYSKLLSNKVTGHYIKSYKEGTGTTLQSKLISIVILWGSIFYSSVYFTDNINVQLLLLIIAVSITIHLFTIPTAKK